MLSKVQKWGNSQGIRIPKNLLENSHIKIGEEVTISAKNGKIIVEPTHKVRGKYDIKDLISKMPKNYEVEEENWGTPFGREVW
ncbi:AbrB/MazE/SpoVT family DNA-binding domain-containing protein [Methyloprofundus sp.]|uniref:AbrB/MazE/SpoVT family DNA-binding domain-containing protein n=1 Tax=Methyloprofundus sp. TaxID=2020875 RepID=UPI003D0E46BF